LHCASTAAVLRPLAFDSAPGRRIDGGVGVAQTLRLGLRAQQHRPPIGWFVMHEGCLASAVALAGDEVVATSRDANQSAQCARRRIGGDAPVTSRSLSDSRTGSAPRPSARGPRSGRRPADRSARFDSVKISEIEPVAVLFRLRRDQK